MGYCEQWGDVVAVVLARNDCKLIELGMKQAEVKENLAIAQAHGQQALHLKKDPTPFIAKVRSLYDLARNYCKGLQVPAFWGCNFNLKGVLMWNWKAGVLVGRGGVGFVAGFGGQKQVLGVGVGCWDCQIPICEAYFPFSTWLHRAHLHTQSDHVSASMSCTCLQYSSLCRISSYVLLQMLIHRSQYPLFEPCFGLRIQVVDILSQNFYNCFCTQANIYRSSIAAIGKKMDDMQEIRGDAMVVCAFVTFKEEQGRFNCLKANPSGTGTCCSCWPLAKMAAKT